MATDPEVVRLVELYLRSPYYRKVPIVKYARHPLASSASLSGPYQIPPHSMISSKPDANGFGDWQPVDSPIDAKIVAGFERFLEIRLPPVFKDFLKYKCLFETDLHFANLPPLDPRHPLGWLEWCVEMSQSPEVRGRSWYIPFASARAGMGVLCFDTQRPDSDGDYPVMLANNKSTELSGFDPEYAELHTSFRGYVGYVCDYLEYIIGGHDNRQPLISWLADRGRPIPPEVRYCQPWF